MICPSCEKESICGCKSCQERPGEHERNIMEENTIKCPYCNFKSSYDVWLDYEYKKYNEK